MAVNANEEGQDSHSVTVLPEEPINNPQRELKSEFPSRMCLDSQSNGQKHNHAKMENMEGYAPLVVHMDIEKGKLETPKSSDGAARNTKTEDSFTRALQREISFQIGGKLMRLLMNHSLEVPKFTSRDKCTGERVHDTPTYRSRKYKRSASFNSRRVALLFSVLSIMGTMILIYLTVRVRQLSDAAWNA